MTQKSLFNRLPQKSNEVQPVPLSQAVNKSRTKILTPVKERDNVIIENPVQEEMIINNELIPDKTEEE